RLVAALKAFPILGVRTNVPFLLRILEHPRFRAGEIDTGFLDGEGASLAEAPPSETPAWVAAVMNEAARALTDAAKSRDGRGADSVGPAGGSLIDGAARAIGWDPWVRLREWRA